MNRVTREQPVAMQYDQLLLDLKARQQAGEHMPCPRCGKDTMKPALHTNALSRHTDLYVCDQCGTAEALLDFMNNPLPLSCWAAMREPKPKSDLKTMSSDEAMELVRREHVPFLTELYERWQAAPPGTDFDLFRREAYRNCPGMTQIWEQPFQAKYSTTDGHLLIQLSTGKQGTVVRGYIVKT